MFAESCPSPRSRLLQVGGGGGGETAGGWGEGAGGGVLSMIGIDDGVLYVLHGNVDLDISPMCWDGGIDQSRRSNTA